MSMYYSPIAEGEVYPNYKALCKKLGEPIKKGGAKINQLAHWQTCFLWERKGNKYKITKIIKPLDQRPHKQREDSKWYKSVTIILLNKIADTIIRGCGEEGFNELVLTSIEAYIALGLCNGEFRNLKAESFSNIPIEHRIIYYKNATKKFYYILTNVLKSLKSQSIINYNKTYRLTEKNKNTGLRLATYKEHTIIIDIVQKLLVKYNLRSEYDVVLYHKETAFYTEFNTLLEQEGFYNCFKVYRIYFTETCFPKFNEYIDSLETQTTAKIDINSKSYKDLLRKIEDINIEANNLSDHFTFSSNLRELIELTIPINN
jgi:hypothetical protein